jgi:hypothetical protein
MPWWGRSVFVAGDEGVDRGLGGEQGLEGRVVAQQLAAQRLVEALDLAGGGRAGGLGEAVGDAVVAADPVEQDLAAAAEAVGELLAVVGEDLVGDAVAAQRFDQRQADRAAGGAGDHGCDDDEP